MSIPYKLLVMVPEVSRPPVMEIVPGPRPPTESVKADAAPELIVAVPPLAMSASSLVLSEGTPCGPQFAQRGAQELRR